MPKRPSHAQRCSLLFWLMVIAASSFLGACQNQQSHTTTLTKPLVHSKPKLPQVDSIFETFEHKTKDTTYLMKKYFVCFLKTGPNRNQDEKTAAEIQKAHLAHMEALSKDKKICAAGPMGDDGDIKGIVIYSVANQAEADSLTQRDPAVKAGRLTVELHPWWAAVGTTLF